MKNESPFSPVIVLPLCAALLLACASPTPGPRPSAEPAPDEAAAEETPMRSLPGPKTPDPPRTFVDGSPLSPADALLAWLQAHARQGEERTRLQLPVVVRFKDGPLRSIDEAFIGASAEPASDAVRLALNDSAMGISLHDRLQAACPEEAPTCAVWLEGYWGALLPLEPAQEGRWPFSVLRVSGRVEGAGPFMARIEARPTAP